MTCNIYFCQPAKCNVFTDRIPTTLERINPHKVTGGIELNNEHVIISFTLDCNIPGRWLQTYCLKGSNEIYTSNRIQFHPCKTKIINRKACCPSELSQAIQF